MITKAQLIQEIEQTPEPLIPEILDFILFLKSRQPQASNFSSNAESPLLQKHYPKMTNPFGKSPTRLSLTFPNTY
jgi:hypothetical protein